jgi:outer membrane lipoprotein carrier protein
MRKFVIGAAVVLAVLIIGLGVRAQIQRPSDSPAGGELASGRPGAVAIGDDTSFMGVSAPIDGAGAESAAPPVGLQGEGGITPPPVGSAGATPAQRTGGSGTGAVSQPQTPAALPQPSPVSPQAPQPSRILQEASDRYSAIRSLRARFTMNTVNPLLRTTTTSRGLLHQVRPDRLALRFTDPDGDVIVADGQHFWMYYPSVNAQQVVRTQAGAAGTTVDLQAQFLGDPVRRFEHTLDGTEAVGGRETYVMTLVPRQQAEFKRLRVWIDAQDRLVRRFEVTELNDVVRRMELENLELNPTIAAETFRFTPPAGARVIDR